MKYINILIIISIMNVSCKNNNPIPSGYTKFQTFNEYALKGILGNTKNLKSPYVFVKEDTDTISVIVSNQIDNIINYVNKGEYWYSIRKEQLKYNPDCKCDTIPYYFVKYICNDTIFTYDYSIENNKKYIGDLLIETKKSTIRLSLKEDIKISNEDEFKVLRYLAENYKESFPYYNREHQSCYYQSFTKVFKDNMLYLYENNGTDKLLCLKDVRQLNSLGEFDSHKGVSIIDRIQDDNKCK